MGEELLLMHRKIPVKDVEHLAFHPTNVMVLEDAGTPRPNDVFHHPIVKVLKCDIDRWNQHNDVISDVTKGGWKNLLCQRVREPQRRSSHMPTFRRLSASGVSLA